jgi:tetratricopeptide (TPR) repeat protein
MHRLRAGRLGVLAGLVGGALATASAMYVEVDVSTVPISRLIGNLERQAKADPADVDSRLNLARLHAMAYALKIDQFTVTVDKATGAERPWYGHDPEPVPDRPRPAKTPEAEAAAKEHLKESIAFYEDALKLAPKNLTAMLGYGWMLNQAGDSARAIEQLRGVVEIAWPSEKDMQFRGIGKLSYVYEAAGYLIPLLNRERDAVEIADLQAKRDRFERMPRLITPIAVPLTPGLAADRLHDPLARVRFDADGSGCDREWTWIAPDAGWLVYDADGRGQITSALQLFGNVTFWLFWENGYDALAALDDNGSGVIEGAELAPLAIWRDTDRDGVSDAGEVQPVSTYGIVALSYDHEAGDGTTFAAVSMRGAQFVDGATRPTYDIILKSPARIRTLAPLR